MTTTSLKKYEGALVDIQNQAAKIRMLEDCRNSQSPFNENASCFKLMNGLQTYKYSPTGYSLYSNNNLLTDISATGMGHAGMSDSNGVSYNNILSSFIIAGYETNVNDYTKFEQDITDLSGALNNRGHFNNNIQTKYKNVNDLRSELDNKMRDIYNPEEQDAHRLHDQSIYMTLSWTILATSVLYYLFVKL